MRNYQTQSGSYPNYTSKSSSQPVFIRPNPSSNSTMDVVWSAKLVPVGQAIATEPIENKNK